MIITKRQNHSKNTYSAFFLNNSTQNRHPERAIANNHCHSDIAFSPERPSGVERGSEAESRNLLKSTSPKAACPELVEGTPPFLLLTPYSLLLHTFSKTSCLPYD